MCSIAGRGLPRCGPVRRVPGGFPTLCALSGRGAAGASPPATVLQRVRHQINRRRDASLQHRTAQVHRRSFIGHFSNDNKHLSKKHIYVTIDSGKKRLEVVGLAKESGCCWNGALNCPGPCLVVKAVLKSFLRHSGIFPLLMKLVHSDGDNPQN